MTYIPWNIVRTQLDSVDSQQSLTNVE